MTKQAPRVKLNLTLPIEVKARAKNLANSLNISVSHLIEGLIMGVQIVSGEEREKN